MNLSQAGAYNTPQPASGADFYFQSHGRISVLVGVSPDGRQWIADNLPADTLHWAGGVVIEARCVPEILEGIAGDGLLVGGGY